ncbi:MAG: sigma-70 family RNA polymerase sigma factor [Planctomycetes bacterium]|nr:sigma-70 family RNA polymerase sigma factor [Planctomycetota bacterium]
MLWRRFARQRHDEVRNHLVVCYQEFVHEIVRRFAAKLPPNVDPGDLSTAANVGLIAAIESFDRKRGVPFESYCELRVRGALIDELRSQDWLPRPWRARVEQRKRALESLRGTLGREPFDDDVAAALGISSEEYSVLFGSGLLFAQPGAHARERDTGALLDVVPDTHADLPIERLTREELLALVTQCMTPQECRIVYLKYWEDLPLREIGELEGLSESRVCKIHMKLLERLQARFVSSVGA